MNVNESPVKPGLGDAQLCLQFDERHKEVHACKLEQLLLREVTSVVSLNYLFAGIALNTPMKMGLRKLGHCKGN